MRRFLIYLVLLCSLASGAATAAAATPAEFYSSLLQRGVSAFTAGRYEDAVRHLRVAAFGFVDAVPLYQTAQAYLALAHDRLGQAERSREAARRVVAAERLEAAWGGVTLPSPARDAFESLAARVLAPAELALLESSSVAAPPPPTVAQGRQPAAVTPRPAVPPPPAPVTPPAPEPRPPAATPAVTGTNGHAHAPVEQPVAAAPEAKPAPDAVSLLVAAERALGQNDLEGARRLYGEVLTLASVSRENLIRGAEGLYRSRDFKRTLEAFARVGDLRDAEQPYRYYIAVAAYETGDYERARTQLAAALPFIEITPDVARYRAKIEGAIN